MASYFEDSFETASTERELKLFGETVSYTPAGGQARNIEAIVLRETKQTLFRDASDNVYQTLEIFISNESDTVGVISPTTWIKANGDSLTLDGLTYYVIRILETVAGLHRLLISTSKNAILTA